MVLIQLGSWTHTREFSVVLVMEQLSDIYLTCSRGVYREMLLGQQALWHQLDSFLD